MHLDGSLRVYEVPNRLTVMEGLDFQRAHEHAFRSTDAVAVSKYHR